MQAENRGIHKALLPLNGKPLLFYLIDNIKKAGIKEIVPVLGYQGEELLAYIKGQASEMSVYPVWNDQYENTNNLVSLLQAETVVADEEFIQLNGDMVFDYRIVTKIAGVPGAAIAVDTNEYSFQLDSPRVLIKDGMILDLGRHLRIEETNGYAVGIYRFSKVLAKHFFEDSKELVKKNSQLGFHEPLRQLFHQYVIAPVSTGTMLWMDVDEKADIEKAERYLCKMEEENK